jgi:hypothetical protein
VFTIRRSRNEIVLIVTPKESHATPLQNLAGGSRIRLFAHNSHRPSIAALLPTNLPSVKKRLSDRPPPSCRRPERHESSRTSGCRSDHWLGPVSHDSRRAPESKLRKNVSSFLIRIHVLRTARSSKELCVELLGPFQVSGPKRDMFNSHIQSRGGVCDR